MTNRKLGFAGLLAAVLVAGAALGVIGDRLLARRPMVMRVHTDMSPVLARLDLTREQRARADSIVSRRTPTSESIMLDMANKLRTVTDSIDRELRSILTPIQIARLDSLRANGKLVLKRKLVTPAGTTIDTLTLPRKP